VSDGSDAASFLYLLLVLVMVASSFFVRRVPLGQTLKMALAWLLIFGALFVAFTLRDDFRALGRRLWSEEAGGQVAGAGGEVRIRRAEDGHFWADAEVNGEPVRFLVDSGATVTGLSAATARRAGVAPGGGFPVLVDTANGTVEAQRARIDRFVLGSIERRDLGVYVAEAFGDTDVLGMNFLSSLSGWSVEGSTLVLRP
jgi:aspartyl protease family protein